MIFDEIKSSNKAFLDLENPVEQKVFEEMDYSNILSNLGKFGIHTNSRAYVFLDEIQAMPEVVRAVKYLHDHYDIKFFLTGSSSFYLKNLFPESLAGRKFIFELFPLDFEEFLVFKNVPHTFANGFRQKAKNKNFIAYEKTKKYYEEYVQYGGFPAVVLGKSREEKELKLKDVFTSYFEKDVKTLADFREIKAFRDLVLLLMQRIGSKIEIAKLSSEVGVSRETVYSFLSFLEHTYFVNFITPLSRNVDREVSGGRKVYVCDTGLVNHFAKVSEGSVFENAVFLNLKKYGKIQFYQKRIGAEIDFIVNEKTAFEAKLKGVESDYRKLEKASRALDINQYYLITRDFLEKPYAVPAYEI